jgi:L-proline amide hydrolase
METTIVEATTRAGFLDFRGMKVWYHVAGPLPTADGRPPLLLLHGGPGGTSDGFEPLDALAHEGRTVIRYDELGSGRSDRPDDPSLWQPSTFVDLLERVRDELGLDRVHLLGGSWGGMLLLEYLRTPRAGVASIVLASAPASAAEYLEDANRLRQALPSYVQGAMRRFESRWTPPMSPVSSGAVVPGWTDEQLDEKGRALQKQMELALRPSIARVAAFLNRFLPRSQLLYDVASGQYVTEHVLRTRPVPFSAARMVAGMGREVYETMWGPSEFFGGGTLAAWSAHEWLDRIDVPTLVTCGRYDTVPPERAATIAAKIPGAELVVFEHSGHGVYYDEPDSYFATLTDFLARHDDRS